MADFDFFSRFKFSTDRGVRSLLSGLRAVEPLAMEGSVRKAFLDPAVVDPIGIPRIDEQHRLLVNLINRFHQVLVVNRDRSMADDLFSHFIRTARIHFDFEEAGPLAQNCPGYGDHFDQHSEAMVEVQDLQRRFKAGTLSASVLLTCLRNWMIGHSRGSDQRHARYMSHLGLGPG